MPAAHLLLAGAAVGRAVNGFDRRRSLAVGEAWQTVGRPIVLLSGCSVRRRNDSLAHFVVRGGDAQRVPEIDATGGTQPASNNHGDTDNQG